MSAKNGHYDRSRCATYLKVTSRPLFAFPTVPNRNRRWLAKQVPKWGKPTSALRRRRPFWKGKNDLKHFLIIQRPNDLIFHREQRPFGQSLRGSGVFLLIPPVDVSITYFIRAMLYKQFSKVGRALRWFDRCTFFYTRKFVVIIVNRAKATRVCLVLNWAKTFLGIASHVIFLNKQTLLELSN